MAHKQCLDLLTISCQEQQGLRHSLPIYLLAHDKHEQKRWIRTIELHRKRAETMMMGAHGHGHSFGQGQGQGLSVRTDIDTGGTAVGRSSSDLSISTTESSP